MATEARLQVVLTNRDDVAAVVAHCHNVLGDPAEWSTPDGYPDGLALCVLDSVWSIGIRYTSVRKVVARYRTAREGQGANPNTDGLSDLTSHIAAVGGVDAWRTLVGTGHLTSSRGGIFKADAVEQVSQAMLAHGLTSTADVRRAHADVLAAAERAWKAVRGQGSGISWRYMLLLTGAPEVKPDRMICRFLEHAVNHYPGLDEAVAMVKAAAVELDVPVRALDHRIWRFQSRRG